MNLFGNTIGVAVISWRQRLQVAPNSTWRSLLVYVGMVIMYGGN